MEPRTRSNWCSRWSKFQLYWPNHPISWPLIFEKTWLCFEKRALRAQRIGRGWTFESVVVHPNLQQPNPPLQNKNWQNHSHKFVARVHAPTTPLQTFGASVLAHRFRIGNCERRTYVMHWASLQTPFSCSACLVHCSLWLFSCCCTIDPHTTQPQNLKYLITEGKSLAFIASRPTEHDCWRRPWAMTALSFSSAFTQK